MVDLLVLGSGVAGLSAAVRAAARGLAVTLLTKGELGHGATRYAQGGVAAAFGPGDSPELHLSDTLAAGAGLCDPEAARVLVSEGPDRLRELIEAGALFDSTGDGEATALAMAREGGHSTARVIHAGGDATGAEIERALVAALGATGVEVREGWFAVDLLAEGGRCAGVVALDPEGRRVEVRTRDTLLASGGAGQLFAVTTNPPPSTGDGTAMALRAGVAVADLEFVQFHPTALHREAMPRPLLSEALRGEGAVLRDERGEAFMAAEHTLGDLAPRDVVARALAQRLAESELDHLWLDATGIGDFSRRFPTIHRACVEAGLDPADEWLPVAPAAHYHCGGVLTDLDGATSLPGFWAVGEAACTGAHGANRLASNSLLEGLVFAPRAVAALAGGRAGPAPTGAMRAFLEGPGWVEAGTTREHPPSSPPRSEVSVADLRRRIQRAMTAGAGVVRSAASLAAAGAELDAVGSACGAAGSSTAGSSAPGVPAGADLWEVRNLVDVGHALVRAALVREESRGAHTRSEFPEPSPRFHGRLLHVGDRTAFAPASPRGAAVR